MFQYMLLLLEAALLIATAYIFWQTRRTAAEIADNPPPPVKGRNSTEQQAQAARMMHEVTTLVTELQSLADATYQDFMHQKEELDQVISQANTSIAELRNLVAQADTIPAKYAPFPVDPPDSTPRPVAITSSSSPSAANTITWGQTITEFNTYLADNDRTDNTIARANTHIRQFLNWRNGKHFEDIPLSQITPSELNDYADYLTEQSYQDSTVQRKMTALRIFIQWVETWPQNPLPPRLKASPPKVGQDRPDSQPNSPVESAAPPLSASNRFKTVFALAEQGLDQSDIAARTGLEQEAVRMLLLVRSNGR